MKWLVRARGYSSWGGWWLFGFDSILSGIFGVYYGLKEGLLEGVVIAFFAHLIFAGTKSVFGYLDEKYFHRIQYENEFTSHRNPVLMEIKKNSKRSLK